MSDFISYSNISGQLEGGLDFVTIVMPALNEEKYIEDAIKSLLPRSKDLGFELLVLDGGSTDKTVEIVENISAQDSRVKIIHNPKRIQSAGINLGVSISDVRSRVFIRADCHANYPDNFVECCLKPFSDPKIAAVVVPMFTQGISCFQRAVSAAQNSWLGNGGSAHRRKGISRLVEHGHHAAIRKDFFQKLNGYDENFTHNEDAELDARISNAGGLIWLAANVPITYFPRPNAIALARQYYRHGQGRAMTIMKHKHKPKLRQMAPLVVTMGNVIAICLAPFLAGLSLIGPISYVLACTSVGLYLSIKQKDRCSLLSGIAAMIMHAAWAIGFSKKMILR